MSTRDRARSLDRRRQRAIATRISHISLATTLRVPSQRATDLPGGKPLMFRYSDPFYDEYLLRQGSDLELGSSAETWTIPSRTHSVSGKSTDAGFPGYEKDDTPPATPTPSAPPVVPFPSFSKGHEIAFIFNICLAQFITLCCLAQSVAPLLIIGDSFGVKDPGTLSWFTAGYSLAVGTLILPAGRLGDIFGHKLIFLIGWAWFAIWSFTSGFSYGSGHVMFSVCRAFQGVGPALVVPNAMALIGRSFPVGLKRNIVFSCFGAAGPTGFFAGAMGSSLISQYAWWPWAFWAAAIVQIIILIMSSFVIPWPTRQQLASAPKKPKFDYFGAVMGVSSLTFINFALNQAPISGWKQAYIWETMLIGFVLLAGFVYVEIKISEFPLIPISGLKLEAWAALICIAMGWSGHGIWVYYLFLFSETIRGRSAVRASAEIAPVVITGVAFALSTGLLMKRLGPAWIMFIAMGFFTIGAVFLATAPVGQTYWGNTFWSILIMPGGMNLSFPAGMILLSNAMPPENQGIAASLVATIVNYSISCGLGLAATVDVNVSKHGERVIEGFRASWYLGIGVSVLGWATSAWMLWRSKRANR